MKGEHVSWNGRLVQPCELEIPFPELLAAHYIYQRVHISGGRALRLGEHLAIASRTLWNIHRTRPVFNPEDISKHIAALLKTNRYREDTDSTAMLYFFPDGESANLLIVCERPLINRGYAVSSLRPSAISYAYRLPYEGFPTNFLLSAARFHDALATEHGASKSVRRDGDKLLGCGDAPLFGIRGRTLFTAPLTDGAADSVERKLVINAAVKSGLGFLEESVLHPELRDFDELFYADAAGITSLGECDGAKFMSLLVSRIAAQIKSDES